MWTNTFSRLIMSLLHLGRLWFPRHLGRVSLLLLAFRRFIRMLTTLVLSFFSLFLLFSSPHFVIDAYAQTPTVDPCDPCGPPPCARVCIDTQPTSRPDYSVECPEGLPGGFGTVTPSPLWLLECSHCLTQLTPTYEWPTMEPGPTLDPTLFPVTPTVELTPTVTGTPQPSLYDRFYVVSGTGSSICNNPPISNWSCAESGTKGPLTSSQREGGSCAVTLCDSQRGVPPIDEIIFISDYYAHTDGVSPLTRYFEEGSIIVEGGATISGSREVVITNSSWLDHSGYQFSVTSSANRRSAEDPYLFYSLAISLSIPELPEPTPGPSMCDEIQSSDGEEDPADMFPRIWLGPSTCFTIPSFNGLDLGLGWIPILGPWIDNLTFSGIEFCAQEFGITDLKFLGITIDPNILLFVMAGAAIFRIFMRS